MPSSNQIIKDCIKSTQENIERAKKSFSHLSDIQLNWKPQADKWSVGECISHLVKTNNLYLTKIESIFTLAAFGAEKDFHYKQSFMGKLIAKGVNPASVRKTKTFKVFFPGII
ncbi:MAG TPA: DinB family protein [Ignavibacteriaceae bacterium]|nr:DinB family protein [Ignavibacteriaceae bacterium]